MEKIFAYLQKPQVHAALALLAQLCAIFFPQYKPILDTLSMAGTYGAAVTVGTVNGGKK